MSIYLNVRVDDYVDVRIEPREVLKHLSDEDLLGEIGKRRPGASLSIQAMSDLIAELRAAFDARDFAAFEKCLDAIDDPAKVEARNIARMKLYRELMGRVGA
jgi:hypothetical protein